MMASSSEPPRTPAEASDAALVEAAQRGNKDAFATLLLRHRPLLVALCRRMLGDAALAEDAAQEATLQALLSLDGLRRPERFGPWLGGIGLNVCRRWLRERTRENWSWEALAGGRRPPVPADLQDDPQAYSEARELARRVRRAVQALPRGQRAAVLLVYLAGLTQAEAAALLGTRTNAVKTRLHKARTALRRELEAFWQEETMTTEQVTGPIAMRVVDVRRRQPSAEGPAMYVIVLEETGGSRRLPIWIGPAEGAAMALQMEGATSHRPLTYAFAARVLQAAGARLREVRIERLADDTFYAVCVIEGAGGTQSVDARPSDALNLALTAGALVFAQPAVLEQAGIAAEHWDERRPCRPGETAAAYTGAPFEEGAAQIAAEIKAEWERR